MQLEKATTLLIMPFYLTDGNPLQNNSQIWERCQMAFDTGKLYEHIQKIMIGKENTHINYQYEFYSLSDKSEEAKALKNMIRIPMGIIEKFPDGKANAITFNIGAAELSKEEKEEAERKAGREAVFENTKETFFSPKILICPQASIGLLILSVSLTSDNYSLQDLMTLNNSLFKTYPQKNNAQNTSIYTKTQTDVIIASAGLNEKNLDEKAKRIAQMRLQGQREAIPEKLITIQIALPNKNSEELEPEAFSWTMTDLIDRLMVDFKGNYCRFDSFRLHLFTYMQLPQEEFTQTMLDDYVRVMRIQNHKYQVIKDSIDQQLYTRTFENIYMGASVEGGCIMTLLPHNVPDEDVKFIRDFDKDALKCYLWIYIMVLMQRHTLINMERKMTEWDFDGENTKEKRDTLQQLISHVATNKVNTHFADVSDHIQHNQFYNLCCINMRIPQHFADVDQKLNLLKEHLNIQINEEVSKEEKRQTGLQQESLKQQKVAEANRQKQEKIRENRRRRLEILLTVLGLILTIFSAVDDTFDLFENTKLGLFNSTTPLSQKIIIVLGSIIVIGGLLWIIVDRVRSRIDESDQ